jgi:hypothetical protein
MTKNKIYKFGHNTLKCAFRPVGHGYEVCLTWDKKTIFVGNFVHKVEANRWWGVMNRELHHFTRTYWYNGKVTGTWYANFFANHIYATYYAWLDKAFTKYTKTYTRAFTRDAKKYRTMKRTWTTGHGAHATKKYTLKSA